MVLADCGPDPRGNLFTMFVLALSAVGISFVQWWAVSGADPRRAGGSVMGGAIQWPSVSGRRSAVLAGADIAAEQARVDVVPEGFATDR